MAEYVFPAPRVLTLRWVEYRCDVCGGETMYVEYDGNDSNDYIHQCSNCGKRHHLSVQYPLVRDKRM